MTSFSRQPGWDKQAVNGIAADQYGGLAEMFAAHGWVKNDNNTYGQVAPSRVTATYGSVDAFVRAHENGRAGNALLDPLAAVNADPPQVFLKSFYGFTPETWGFLGYTDPTMRDWFLRESKPGALVVIAGTSTAHVPGERLRILGIQQQSHVRGTKWDFLAPERHAREKESSDRERRWLHALKATRAWRIADEERAFVRDIFPTSHDGGKNGTVIGSYGKRLTAAEAKSILDLTLVEVPVFGSGAVDALMPGPAGKLLRPSRPGPVSQSAYIVREAEGPKHLYILRLMGEERHLLGYDALGRWVVKVGFSVSPATRCQAHNQTLPACAFGWEVMHSTHADGHAPFASSSHALAGEKAMKDFLDREGDSLGGEFFLASPSAISKAWHQGVLAAENHKKT